MGAIVTKKSYDNIELINHTENPICSECVKEIERFENQKIEYNSKYDENVLALNKPDFIHTDILYDIYKKSVQVRIDKIKSMNSTVFRVNIDEYKCIGKEIYNEYMANKHVNQSMNIDMNNQMKFNFIMGQKIIYDDIVSKGLSIIKVKYELYLLYFIDRIIFFIFVLFDTDYRLYFKEYFFDLNYNFYKNETKKKKMEAVISDTFEKYFMYMTSEIKILNEVKKEVYLYSIKNDIESKFKIIDLMDMCGFFTLENRLLKNPIFEFHFLIEKQINKIRKIQ